MDQIADNPTRSKLRRDLLSELRSWLCDRPDLIAEASEALELLRAKRVTRTGDEDSAYQIETPDSDQLIFCGRGWCTCTTEGPERPEPCAHRIARRLLIALTCREAQAAEEAERKGDKPW